MDQRIAKVPILTESRMLGDTFKDWEACQKGQDQNLIFKTDYRIHIEENYKRIKIEKYLNIDKSSLYSDYEGFKPVNISFINEINP